MYQVRHKDQETARCTFALLEDAEEQVRLFEETEGAGVDAYLIEEVQKGEPE